MIEEGDTSGATEKRRETMKVRTERTAPATRVIEVSEGVAINGDCKNEDGGIGGWSVKMDRAKARYPVKR